VPESCTTVTTNPGTLGPCDAGEGNPDTTATTNPLSRQTGSAVS
jgi:hypothetical protein